MRISATKLKRYTYHKILFVFQYACRVGLSIDEQEMDVVTTIDVVA